MLQQKIKSRDFNLSVIGTGRVGLPLAVAFASAGVRRVVGIDRDPALIGKIQKGISPFKKERHLEEKLRQAIKMGNLSFTMSYQEEVSDADVVIICVGTPLTHDLRPQITAVVSSFEETLRCLRKNEALVVIRSTVPPGTTKNILMQTAKRRQQENLYVAYCPERLMEGFALEELGQLSEIVGSESEVVRKCCTELFKLLNPNITVLYTDPTSAEVGKIFCNIYRYTNFALANEFALIAENLGVNAVEIIKIINQEYKRGGIPLPGPAGGPCLYKDGYFLDDAFAHEGLTRKAWQINEYVPLHIVAEIRRFFGSLYKVTAGVLGITYKRGSDNTRYSPALKIVEALKDQGAVVRTFDPNVKNLDSLTDVLNSDVVILAIDHPEFAQIDVEALGSVKLFYDCWTMFLDKATEFNKRGIKYKALGVGSA